MSDGSSACEGGREVLRCHAVSSSQMPISVGGETTCHKNSYTHMHYFTADEAAQEIGLKFCQLFFF